LHFAVYAAGQLNLAEEAAEISEMGKARWIDTARRATSVRQSSVPDKLKEQVINTQAIVIELEEKEQELMRSGVAGMTNNLQEHLGIAIGSMVKVRLTADPNGVEAKRIEELAKVRRDIESASTKLNGLLDEASKIDLTVSPSIIKPEKLRSLSEKTETAITYLVSTVWGSVAVIIHDGKFSILQFPDLTRDVIERLLNSEIGYLNTSVYDENFESCLRNIESELKLRFMVILEKWALKNYVSNFGIIALGDFGLFPIQLLTKDTTLTIKILTTARVLDFILTSKDSVEKGSGLSVATYFDPPSKNLRGSVESLEEQFPFQDYKYWGAFVYVGL